MPRIQSLVVRLTLEEVRRVSTDRYALTDNAAQDVLAHLGHVTENVYALLALHDDQIIEGALHFSSGGIYALYFERKSLYMESPARYSQSPKRRRSSRPLHISA